jgi:Rrf2 family protein
MKFNTKTRYGLRTMLEIAVRRNEGGILQKEIAENQGISVKYLDPIIASLKASGLIAKAGGRTSGYRLTRDPGKISIYDVFRSFEEELVIADCIIEENDLHNPYGAAREFWQELNDIIMKKLQSVKLEDLSKRQRIMNEKKGDPMFYI